MYYNKRPLIEMLPDGLDFDVEFEDTKVRDKKYVINGETGEYLGVVGSTFRCANHNDFFGGVYDTVTEHLGEAECKDMTIKWNTAKHNAWAMMDIVLPNVTARVETEKHSTDIAQRIMYGHCILRSQTMLPMLMTRMVLNFVTPAKIRQLLLCLTVSKRYRSGLVAYPSDS